MIASLDQGLIGMRIGGKRRLTISAAIAYGEQGAGKLVPPHASLVFEAERLAIRE